MNTEDSCRTLYAAASFVDNLSKSIIRMFGPGLVLFNISKISDRMKVSLVVAVALWRRVVPG